MSVWVAGATVAVGAYSGYQANKASSKAASAQGKATEAQLDIENQRLDLAYEQYDDQLEMYDEWKAIYGPIEENLADFYNNLDPSVYEAIGLQYNAEEFAKAKTDTLTTLAQRGLASAGVVAAIEGSTQREKAKADAKVRLEAPFKVAQEKTNFLSAGRGGPTYGPTNPASDVLKTSGVPNALQNEANISANAANSLWGSAGSLLSTGLKYYGQNREPSVAPQPMIDPEGLDASNMGTPGDPYRQ